jgi:hypothetical protein
VSKQSPRPFSQTDRERASSSPHASSPGQPDGSDAVGARRAPLPAAHPEERTVSARVSRAPHRPILTLQPVAVRMGPSASGCKGNTVALFLPCGWPRSPLRVPRSGVACGRPFFAGILVLQEALMPTFCDVAVRAGVRSENRIFQAARTRASLTVHGFAAGRTWFAGHRLVRYRDQAGAFRPLCLPCIPERGTP